MTCKIFDNIKYSIDIENETKATIKLTKNDDLTNLIKDGLVESIWCKNGSDEKGCNEIFYQVKADEIDFSALDWHKVDVKKGLLYAVIRHYMIVLKNGIIPPKYITKE